jgi:hypothetical protein
MVKREGRGIYTDRSREKRQLRDTDRREVGVRVGKTKREAGVWK